MVASKEPQPKKIIVIQYEQFFTEDEASQIQTSIKDSLDTLRMYGGARIIGSYEDEDNREFRDRAVFYIKVNFPTEIEVD